MRDQEIEKGDPDEIERFLLLDVNEGDEIILIENNGRDVGVEVIEVDDHPPDEYPDAHSDYGIIEARGVVTSEYPEDAYAVIILMNRPDDEQRWYPRALYFDAEMDDQVGEADVIRIEEV